MCVSKLCVSRLCGDKLYVDKLCVSKLCEDKLCVSKLCGDKLCVSKLCDDKLCAAGSGREAGGGREAGRAEVHNQKQEPRTKMWGMILGNTTAPGCHVVAHMLRPTSCRVAGCCPAVFGQVTWLATSVAYCHWVLSFSLVVGSFVLSLSFVCSFHRLPRLFSFCFSFCLAVVIVVAISLCFSFVSFSLLLSFVSFVSFASSSFSCVYC